MNPVPYTRFKLQGETGKLVDNIIDNWLIGLRESNPAILDMFRDRDVKPYRDLLPWSGEFAGKYVTGAYYAYKLTGNQVLFDYIVGFLDELVSLQAENGYLGCFSEACQLTGAFSQTPEKSGDTWDSWGHYHAMFGLLLWHELTGKQAYLDAVERAAALYISRFYNGNRTLVSIGWSEMNLAIYHVFGLLYCKTKKQAYLDFARLVENDIADEAAGNYINYALEGREYYECPKPRWESMHVIMGIAQMYRCTGDKKYLDVAKQIFFSILKTDVHNTGAFSTDEQAIGHPFRNSNIETCCVIAYNALGIELFAMTGDIRIVDFLERAHYNAVLGYYSPTGRWSTYNTPMDGVKCANYHSIGFQCRPGSPDLNCCSVNAPRGVASVSEWLLTEQDGCLYLNFYEKASLQTADGVTIDIVGDYPAANRVAVRICADGKRQAVALRIPAWSKNTVISVGNEQLTPVAGEYFLLDRTWNGEVVDIVFDFTPYIEAGDKDYVGKSSLFVGPVLYGFDNGDNPTVDFDAIPPIDYAALTPVRQADGSILLETADGLLLRDFYHLGLSGSAYKTWLTVQ